MEISSKPGLLVRCHVKENKLVKVDLSLHPTFVCLFEGGPEQEAVLEWLIAYANKRPLPFFAELSFMTPFQQSVLRSLQNIPFGKTLTYQQLAEKIGNPNAARAVGSSCGANPFPLFIPCHRVIQKSGSLGGFTCDPEIKRRLLEFEIS